MADDPIPMTAFGPVKQLALALAGTIALPSPPPATGDLYLIRNPGVAPDLARYGIGGPTYLIKLVQRIGTHFEVDRFLAVENLLVIDKPEPIKNDDREETKLRSYTVDELAQPIAQAIEELNRRESTEESSPEILLFQGVVIHVPEQAPVVVKTRALFGVTAAEAALIQPSRTYCC
ncbi:hypothetical protein [Tautonia sociabilis]|uniref:Uncharacterized protein n=1 Tax=Tautonia sociabilis TaxID=2080755 RepID=A0A432MKB7_9BACT|nr:hypothetical protein [Tautonia sociabilis]RUL87841.1 hypothetical protein TsocGM_09905 [Tautonia sociabilis]